MKKKSLCCGNCTTSLYSVITLMGGLNVGIISLNWAPNWFSTNEHFRFTSRRHLHWHNGVKSGTKSVLTTQTRCSSELSNTLKHHRHSGNLVIKGKSDLAWISHVHWNRALEVSMAAGGATVKRHATYSAPPSPSVCSLGGARVLGFYFCFFFIFVWMRMLEKKKVVSLLGGVDEKNLQVLSLMLSLRKTMLSGEEGVRHVLKSLYAFLI